MRWVDALIDVPEHKAERAGEFWSQALGWPLGRLWTRHPEFRSFAPGEGDAYVHLQTIDGASRVHLDFEVDDVNAESERLARLGARKGDRHAHWHVMSSPAACHCAWCLETATRPDHRLWTGAGGWSCKIRPARRCA